MSYVVSVVGIRLLGAYFIFSALANSGYVLIPLFDKAYAANQTDYAYTSLWVLMSLVFGVLIWLIAKPAAGFIVRGLDKAKTKTPEFDIVGVGTFLIGLYYLTSTLPYAIYKAIYLNQTGDIGMEYTIDYLASDWISAALALVIMLSSVKISKLFNWLRKV